MKYRIKIALLLTAIIIASMLFAGCFKTTEPDSSEKSSVNLENLEEGDDVPDDPTEKNYDNGIKFEEEAEGATVKLKKASPTKFVGSWEATSGDAHYLFGNLDIKIKADGKWTGNVTEEDVKGTWTEKDGGIYLTSEFFNAQLNFTPDDVLVLQYYPFEDSDEPLKVVLTKK